MASKKSLQERKRRLALTLDSSRLGLSAHGRDLRARLSPVQAVKRQVREHPTQVFALTAALVALLTFRVLRRSPKAKEIPPKKAKSLLRALGALLLFAGKPLVRHWIQRQSKYYFYPP